MNGGIEAKNLSLVQRSMMKCTFCGFCKSVCPTFEQVGWDPAVARGRIILSYGLLHGDIPADDSVIETLYQCTTCKDCERRCPSNINVVDIVELARKDLVASGHMLPRHRKVVDRIMEGGNPYGESRGVPEVLEREPRPSRLGYFVGCTAAYRNPSTARATVSILDKLGEDFTIVNENCCGSVLQRIGCNDDDVRGLMQSNIDAIMAQGVKEVLFSCAGCYRMFKEEYPRFVDVPFEVRHVSEYLAERGLKLNAVEGRIITYHDPCHLGRHVGVYQEPRQVLRSIPGAELREMSGFAETSHCCGGGGGMRSAYPELSESIAAKRVDEAAFADLLVTTCPFCVNNLQKGKERTKCSVEIIDLVELVDSLLE